MQKLMVFVAAFLACVSAAASDWSSDFNSALEKAKKDGLPVLLRITGEFPASKAMDEIVASKEFDALLGDYVLIILDVNKVEVEQDGTPKLHPTILGILAETGVGGYPAFIVFDLSSDGFPRAIAIQLGLIEAAGAIQFMDNAKISKKVRDKNFQDSDKAKDPTEKAKALHAALLSIKDYGNVFVYGTNCGYKKVMEEMEKIDPDSNSGGTAFWALYRICNSKYENMSQMRDAVDVFIKRFVDKDKENAQLGYYVRARVLTALAVDDDVLSEEEKKGIVDALAAGIELAPFSKAAVGMKKALEAVKNWPTGKPGAKATTGDELP